MRGGIAVKAAREPASCSDRRRRRCQYVQVASAAGLQVRHGSYQSTFPRLRGRWRTGQTLRSNHAGARPVQAMRCGRLLQGPLHDSARLAPKAHHTSAWRGRACSHNHSADDAGRRLLPRSPPCGDGGPAALWGQRRHRARAICGGQPCLDRWRGGCRPPSWAHGTTELGLLLPFWRRCSSWPGPSGRRGARRRPSGDLATTRQGRASTSPMSGTQTHEVKTCAEAELDDHANSVLPTAFQSGLHDPDLRLPA